MTGHTVKFVDFASPSACPLQPVSSSGDLQPTLYYFLLNNGSAPHLLILSVSHRQSSEGTTFVIQ